MRINGDPGQSRTASLALRRRSLPARHGYAKGVAGGYPAELRNQNFLFKKINLRNLTFKFLSRNSQVRNKVHLFFHDRLKNQALLQKLAHEFHHQFFALSV